MKTIKPTEKDGIGIFAGILLIFLIVLLEFLLYIDIGALIGWIFGLVFSDTNTALIKATSLSTAKIGALLGFIVMLCDKKK